MLTTTHEVALKDGTKTFVISGNNLYKITVEKVFAEKVKSNSEVALPYFEWPSPNERPIYTLQCLLGAQR